MTNSKNKSEIPPMKEVFYEKKSKTYCDCYPA
ncbi:hypothetical protein predicted by Glimmer/Critica [Bdellovibrio bacteriovorus HD100]|uniref:Uncharacterized protein n=1 Tax=Bdellovibrio bacteriovorus (strain ATCC 15356 / DSM 50701 / NCIMB 9529 / HD100) TaxID=264462 RepID=Q6MK47_BDEBA|nr:hypothetical protein predicted by Glimmer/Critica [Bdellovibrio bacteriovorus HD100]